MEISNLVFSVRRRAVAEQLREVFDLGLDTLCLVRSDPPPALGGLEAALRESGARIGHIEAGALVGEGGVARLAAQLTDASPESRAAARQMLDRHIDLAARLDCPRLLLTPAPPANSSLGNRVQRILDLHREGHGAEISELIEEVELLVAGSQDELLDRFCRELHALFRATPGLEISIASALAPGYFPGIDSLGHVLEDLAAHPLSYWHDTAAAQAYASLCGVPPWRWLEQYSRHLAGVYLGDAVGVAGGLVPGSGEVDFKELRGHLPRRSRRVLHLRPGTDREGIVSGLRVLRFLDLES